MKWPLLTSFCGGLVIFAGCIYIGQRTAEVITYRLRKPMTFGSVIEQNDGELRAGLLALQAVNLSQVRQDTPTELQKAIDNLETVHNLEVGPILDMEIAICYVEMARLEREAGNTNSAAQHRQMAEDLLHSLGWKDVSEDATARLTRWQLWQRSSK